MEKDKITTETVLNRAVPAILDWYRRSARAFPWRETRDPYLIWVSEIMLQQTRIGAAIGYYDRFLQEFPTLTALSQAPEERLMKLWQGLGYYSRARNMQKAARLLVQEYRGRFPADYRKLLALPGIGEYTAAAIASAAFALPETAVDGNILRVFTRLTDCREDIGRGSTRQTVKNALQREMPEAEEDIRIFNQALMELGEVVCLPGSARQCDVCPAADVCLGCRRGTAGELPVKAAKKQRKTEEMTVFVLLRQGETALRRRPERGLLAGLWEYPNVPGFLSEEEVRRTLEQWGLQPVRMYETLPARHIFTHREWSMNGWVVEVSGRGPENWAWAGGEAFARYAIPSAFSAFCQAAEKRK